MGPKRGFEAAFRGLRIAFSSSEVRRDYLRLFLVYVIVTLGLQGLGVWGVLEATAADTPDGWRAMGMMMLRWGGVAGAVLLAPFAALFLVNLVFTQFGERLFHSGMRQMAPERAAELAARDGLPLATGAGIALRRLLRFAVFGTALFAWSFVPVVGNISGPLLAFYFGARALTWELLDPYFDKLGLRYADQRAFLRTHRRALLGFGAPMMLLFAIPFVGALFFGFVQAAVAALVLELEAAPLEPGVAAKR